MSTQNATERNNTGDPIADHSSDQPTGTFVCNENKEIVWTNDPARLEEGSVVSESLSDEDECFCFFENSSSYHVVKLKENVCIGSESPVNVKAVNRLFIFAKSLCQVLDIPILVSYTNTGEIIFGNRQAARLLGISSLQGQSLGNFMTTLPSSKRSGYQNIGSGAETVWRRYESFNAQGITAVWFPDDSSEVAFEFEDFLERVSGRLHNRASRKLKSVQHYLSVLEQEVKSSFSELPAEVAEPIDKMGTALNKAEHSVEEEIRHTRPVGNHTLLEHLNRILDEASQKDNLNPKPLTGGARFDVSDGNRKLLLVRLIEEFVTNASYHNPNDSMVELQIELAKDDSVGVITLRENGQGFNKDEVEESGGLSLMKRRAEAARVDLDFQAEVGKGSWLHLQIGDLEKENHVPPGLDIPVPAFLWEDGEFLWSNELGKDIGIIEDPSDVFANGLPEHLASLIEEGEGVTAAAAEPGLLRFRIEPFNERTRVLVSELDVGGPMVQKSVLPVLTVLENGTVVSANSPAKRRFSTNGYSNVSEFLEISSSDLDQKTIAHDPPISIIESSRGELSVKHLIFHIEIVAE
jgi:hypothetical protein